jgi:hypothetical protein
VKCAVSCVSASERSQAETLNEMTVSVAPMHQRPPGGVPPTIFNSANADLLRKVFQTPEPTGAPVHPEEGHRLVKAFLRISSPGRRQAVLKYVTDMARVDEADRTLASRAQLSGRQGRV